MRERCNELCTKPTTGQCKLCDALDERDRFLRVVQWSILLILGSICIILAVLQISPPLTIWNWSIVIQSFEYIVLAITAIIVWKYTRETVLLRVEAQKQVKIAQKQVEETQKQTEAQLRPFISVEPVFMEDSSHGSFIAKNLGNGTAINIRVWFIRVHYELKRREGDNVPFNERL
jgi:hypothetical protein